MTIASTMLSQAVGQGLGALGKPAANKPDDTRKVQALLRKVLPTVALQMQDGVCDGATQRAILDFQQRWGGAADGLISPGGQTLKRLDRLATPLVMRPITLGSVTAVTKDGKVISDGGGYNIGVRTCDGGPLPPVGSGYMLYLAIADDTHVLDVTGRPLHDLMSQDNLGELLQILEAAHWWGVPRQVRAQLRFRGQIISSSEPQVLNAPVQPHNGVMLPLDESSNGPKLIYQGDPLAKDFHGRMFTQVPGFKKKLFIYGGRLELKGDSRGFDCITYVGTTCGAANTHMHDSEDTAESLGAMTCTVPVTRKDPGTGRELEMPLALEEVEPVHAKAFFANPSNSSGYYLMWSGGHIVIVANGQVHEFHAGSSPGKPAGYACTEVATWLAPYKTKRLTVRRLPGKPARAV
jgi:hypothetical protein